MDQKALTRRVEKKKNPLPQPERKKQPLASTSEDEYSDDGSLEEDLDTVIEENNDARRNWDVEQEYEQKSRSGDSIWRRKESTKLPVRSAKGDILPAGASESESESSSELEESDSEEGKPMETIEETSGPLGKVPLSTTEAKEALAKLAEELLESPEEKVSLITSLS